MKKTPKVFSRIARLLDIILKLQVAVVFLTLLFLSLLFFKVHVTHYYTYLTHGKPGLKLDTAGFYESQHSFFKHYMNNGFNNGSAMHSYGGSFSSRMTDSVVIMNGKKEHWKYGKLISVQMTDSLHKINQNWYYDFLMEIERGRLQSQIDFADSLIKSGACSHYIIRKDQSSEGHGYAKLALGNANYSNGLINWTADSTRLVVKGGIIPKNRGSEVYTVDDKTSLLNMFLYKHNKQQKEHPINENMAVFKLDNEIVIEIKNKKPFTFHQNLIKYGFLLTVIFRVAMYLLSTYLLKMFFQRLANGEVFSRRQGQVFTWFGWMISTALVGGFVSHLGKKYVIDKYLSPYYLELHGLNLFSYVYDSIEIIVLIFICFALSFVFKYGQEIQQDNELTI